MLTIRPPAAINGSVCLLTRNVPHTFVSTIRRQLAGSVSSIGRPPPMPALLTSTSTPLHWRLRLAKASDTAASSVMSARRTIAVAPRVRISSAVCSSCGAVRATIATVAPGEENASAIARPIPRPPPVTSTVDIDRRLFLVLRPVAAVFVEEGERFEGFHAVDEEHAIEVIGLVLDDARRKVVRADLDALAVAIEGAHFDLTRTRHAAADVRDAQTSFPVFDHVDADRRDLGIDDRDRVACLAVLVDVEGRDEDAQRFVNLRRGEADAVILGHRLDHVVDEPLHSGGLDLAAIERLSSAAQHRVAHASHLENRHRPGFYLTGESRPSRLWSRLRQTFTTRS